MQHQRLLQSVARNTRLKVLNEIKRTSAGLAVGELASRLGMSYMGVKDLVLDLQKSGLLDHFRQATRSAPGRPQKLYRLTSKAHDLFPTASNPLTIEILQAARKLYGATAAEKLLLVTFQQKAEAYGPRVKGRSLREKAAALVKLRDADGYMAELENDDEGLKIVEHHSPIRDVLEAFPGAVKMETDLFSKLLGVQVEREDTGVSGLYCATFWLRWAGAE
jgi:predicted ArsR family transcriptional regulator